MNIPSIGAERLGANFWNVPESCSLEVSPVQISVNPFISCLSSDLNGQDFVNTVKSRKNPVV